MQQAHNSSTVSKFGSDIIPNISIASLIPFLLTNSNWSSVTPLIFLSVLSLSVLPTIFAVCAIVAAFSSLLLPLSGNSCDLRENIGSLSSFIHVFDRFCHYSDTISSVCTSVTRLLNRHVICIWSNSCWFRSSVFFRVYNILLGFSNHVLVIGSPFLLEQSMNIWPFWFFLLSPCSP